jgi:hypothetical protein
MSLADRAEQPAPPTIHGSPCSIGALEQAVAHDPAEAEGLRRILYDLGWNAGQVFDALAAEKLSVGRQSINRHRGRKCRCFASER